MDDQKKMKDVSHIASVEVVHDLERQAVTDLMIEVVDSADILGVMADGTTLYVMQLSAIASDTLAALFTDSEGDEHDGREPEEDV